MPTKTAETPPELKTLGQAIRHYRNERGMSLRALADRVGVTPPFMSDLEHDRRRTNKLEEIAKALEISPEVLKKLDGRLPDDLKGWLQENPGMIDFLEQVRESGRSIEELRLLFSKPRR